MGLIKTKVVAVRFINYKSMISGTLRAFARSEELIFSVPI